MKSFESIQHDLNEFVNNFDYNTYAPFIHGTLKSREDNIRKNGLMTREDCKMITDNWNMCMLSDSKKTYFDSCAETFHIAKKACFHAYQSHVDDIEEYKLKEDWYSDNCSFFKIKDLNLYKDRVIIDEDNKDVKNRFIEYMNNIQFNPKSIDDLFAPMSHLPKEMQQLLIDAKNIGRQNEFIEMIPDYFLNLSGWGTIAINGSIPFEDLEEISYDDYMNYRKKNCRNW